MSDKSERERGAREERERHVRGTRVCEREESARERCMRERGAREDCVRERCCKGGVWEREGGARKECLRVPHAAGSQRASLKRAIGSRAGMWWDAAVTRVPSQLENNSFTKTCSGSEADSYLRRIDLVYHSSLGLRVIKKKKGRDLRAVRRSAQTPAPSPSDGIRRRSISILSHSE